jgi:HPt (histidine-containing phosphotransfer) domain-containing protein
MPAIDKPTFDELKQMSGEEFINELIDAFLDDAPKMIAELRRTLAAKDAETFRRNAHSMKSNANTFGAVALGEAAKELEMMARQNNLNVGDRVDKLQGLLDQVEAELKALRK